MQYVRKDRLRARRFLSMMVPSTGRAGHAPRSSVRKGIAMQSNGSLRAAAMLVFTTLVWGAMFAIAKGALGAIDAFWLTTWRYAPASLTMIGLLWVVEGRRAFTLDGSAIKLWIF